MQLYSTGRESEQLYFSYNAKYLFIFTLHALYPVKIFEKSLCFWRLNAANSGATYCVPKVLIYLNRDTVLGNEKEAYLKHILSTSGRIEISVFAQLFIHLLLRITFQLTKAFADICQLPDQFKCPGYVVGDVVWDGDDEHPIPFSSACLPSLSSHKSGKLYLPPFLLRRVEGSNTYMASFSALSNRQELWTEEADRCQRINFLAHIQRSKHPLVRKVREKNT